MKMTTYPLLLVFPVAMAFAAAFDLFTMTIPNKISLLLIATFCVVAPIVGMPVNLMLVHAAAALAVLVAGFILFSRGWFGGGDAKLLAAATLWLGFDGLLNFMISVGLLGGVLSVVVLMFRMYVPAQWIARPDWLVKLHLKDSGVPYGLAISAAALIVYPKTVWFTTLLA
jgi:prepilin peptidase CpaA